MVFNIVLAKTNQRSPKLSLHLILTLSFALQILATVGLVGWLSFRNSQKAVDNLAAQLGSHVSSHIAHHLEDYLSIPQQINQTNRDAIALEMLDPADLESMGRFFFKQIKMFDVSYINYGDRAGNLVGVERKQDGSFGIDFAERGTIFEYAADKNGDRLQLLNSYDYDHRRESWYSDAVEASQPIWSQIYQWDGMPEVLSISASYPLYNANNQLVGVLGVDRVLKDISSFLRQGKIGRSDLVFIVERSGLLVASSSEHPSFALANQTAERLLAKDSNDPLVRATAVYLSEKFGTLKAIETSQQLKFSFTGEQQFVRVLPWRDLRGLDWLIVVVMPESEFTAEIDINTRSTILLCLLAFVLATYLAYLTSRWIATPILQLSKASEAIAAGDLNCQVAIDMPYPWLPSIEEVEKLARSFNRMSKRLQNSFTELETRIAQRTVELEKSLQAKEILLKEIHHRVKNNLHVIANLLDLQTDYITDEQALAFFADSQHRIQTMAIIHEQLYQSENLGEINLSDYISRLIDNLVFSCSNRQVKTIIDLESVSLNLETAIPCGLLINELITNSLKHAFPNNRPGEICVELHQDEQQKIHLKIWDNGIGISNEINWQESNSLGLKLVQIFAKQLKAEVECNFNKGVSFYLTFEQLKYRSRF